MVGVSYILSVVAVILSIIALFAMVLATDPVSVVSVFSSFKVPHKLKILAEGESLFNDVTALIIFSFIALPMMNGVDITGVDIVTVSIKVIALSIVIGLLCGFILLSTVTYALTLVFIITKNKRVFESEYDAEHHRS